MMQLPDHANVVRIIGVVTVGSPILLVISFCEHGSLLNYLNQYRVSLASKLQLSRNIAAGMAHIAHCQMIHRDIAARNILITDKEVAQVADFGLARLGRQCDDEDEDLYDVYYKSLNGTFPVRWTAPEAMKTFKFTRETDVWSFGTCIAYFPRNLGFLVLRPTKLGFFFNTKI